MDDFAKSIGAVPVDNEDDFAKSIGAVPIKEEVSQFESGARGAAQGLSMSFADEGTGAAEAVYRVLLGDDKLADLVSNYKKYRDESRKNYDAAQEANPSTYLAGEIGGGVASAFIPGLGALNAAKGAKLAGVAGKAALQGGIAGYGKSEADSIAGDIQNAAIGAGIGGVVGAAGHGLSKGVSALAKNGKKLTTGAVKYGLDLPDDAINAIKQDKTLLNASKNAPGLQGLVELAEKGAEKSASKQSVLADDAWNVLEMLDNINGSEKTAVMFDKVKEIGENSINLIKLQTLNGSSNQAAQKSAINALKNAQEDLMGVNSFSQLKQFIQSVDANINWDAPQDAVKNSALKEFRHQLDTVLKKVSPDYEDIMSKLAGETENLALVKNRLSLKDMYDSAGNKLISRTDLTAPKLETITKGALGAKSRDQVIDGMSKLDPGMSKAIHARALRDILEKDTARGSRSVVGGSVLGALGLIGGVPTGGVAAAAGALGGYARDKFGRDVGAHIIQSLEHGNINAITEVLKRGLSGPYGDVLRKIYDQRGLVAALAYMNDMEGK